MNIGLDNSDLENIKAILASIPEVEKAIVYGSRAKGGYREGSDVDLCLVGQQLNLSLLNTISQKIDSLNLPYIFDISAYHQLSNPELIDHINRVGIIIFSR
jgi:predicted nucleotidyltransferase